MPDVFQQALETIGLIWKIPGDFIAECGKVIIQAQLLTGKLDQGIRLRAQFEDVAAQAQLSKHHI